MISSFQARVTNHKGKIEMSGVPLLLARLSEVCNQMRVSADHPFVGFNEANEWLGREWGINITASVSNARREYGGLDWVTPVSVVEDSGLPVEGPLAAIDWFLYQKQMYGTDKRVQLLKDQGTIRQGLLDEHPELPDSFSEWSRELIAEVAVAALSERDYLRRQVEELGGLA